MDRQSCIDILEKLEWRTIIPYENIPDGTYKLAEYSIFGNLSEEYMCDVLSRFPLEPPTDSDVKETSLSNNNSNNNGNICNHTNMQNVIIDRIKGCLTGLAVADAVGAPLEFLDAVSTDKISKTKGNIFESEMPRHISPESTVSLFSCCHPMNKNDRVEDEEQMYKNYLSLCDLGHYKGLITNERMKNLVPLRYKYPPINKFMLKPGQYTDDTSMALCLADSLIYCTSKLLDQQSLKTVGGDDKESSAASNKSSTEIPEISTNKITSTKWFENESLKTVLQKYKEAKDKHCKTDVESPTKDKQINPSDDSILSFYDGKDLRCRFVCWWHQGYNNTFRFDETRPTRNSVGLGGNIGASLRQVARLKSIEEVPPKCVEGDGAGNGSIMRLAPVAIRFCNSTELALKVAKEQSEATHPGVMASEACRFLVFILVKAITRPSSKVARREQNVDRNLNDIKAFLDSCVDQYLENYRDSINPTFLRLIKSEESSDSLEQNWNWRGKSLPLSEICTRRFNSDDSHTYNGHPVSRGYFGSYAPDGLAIALFSAYNTTCFDDAIQLCIDHLGDADTTGAICGQICGAFYGFENINPILRRNLCIWDRNEIPLRAILLYSLQQFDDINVP